MGALHRLYEHRAIALDFDGTLIDHPNSARLRDFVLSESDRRRFFIVTHRSARSAARLWRTLYHESFGQLGPRSFAGVAFLPLALYDAWCDCVCRRDRGELHGPPTRAERTFVQWKPRTARALGCTILVDDLAALHGPACRAIGMAFVSTNWL
jgi:hypothetical protein